MINVKRIIKTFFYRFPQKYIIFESSPDFSDNTKAVFDEMVRKGIDHRFKFVWIKSDTSCRYSLSNRINYLKRDSLKLKYCLLRAKAVICCNNFLHSNNPRSLNIYLGHGNPLKNSSTYFSQASAFDYIISSSQGMKEIRNRIYGIDLNKLIVLGYPRNDILSYEAIDLHPFFKCDYKKIIVWYPTFRQHKKGTNTGSSHSLPIIWDEEKALRVNECAKNNGVLIVLKPHFAQDVSYIKKLNLSNLFFIDDSFFVNNKLSSYRFVGSCDALLTDYSSIYYDFTLCDKPIGLMWEDYEEYKKNPGFVVDMDFMMKGGVKIYDEEGLTNFIRDIGMGIDRLKMERRDIRDFSNLSTDGKNAERVVQFIIDNMQ